MELVTQCIAFISFLEESQVIAIQNYVCYFYSVLKHILAQLQRSIAVNCVLERLLWYASNSWRIRAKIENYLFLHVLLSTNFLSCNIYQIAFLRCSPVWQWLYPKMNCKFWRLLFRNYVLKLCKKLSLAFHPVKTEMLFPMDMGAICLVLLKAVFTAGC